MDKRLYGQLGELTAKASLSFSAQSCLDTCLMGGEGIFSLALSDLGFKVLRSLE